jgi:pimeloyl-ACP methyl ester carboxylesterase
MREGQITLKDGRLVAFADYGTPGDTAVVWCHGGPGSRFEAEVCAPAATRAGLRLIGIDRPGYGGSSPQVGRTIGGWVPDAIAVLDHLDIDRFVSVGASTGGAYALALAAQSRRVIGVVACCALTDMRWTEGRAMIPGALAVWQAPSREAAAEIVAEQFGERGEKIAVHTTGEGITVSDRALFANSEILATWLRNLQEMFVQGVGGYTDDRLADGVGWGSFDVSAITCPVIVLHGRSDTFVPMVVAHHTASIVPGATLQVVEDRGHFSILTELPGAISQVLARASGLPVAVAQ